MVGGYGAESRSPAGWCTSTPRDDTWWRSAEWTSGMRTAKQYYLRKAKCEMTTIAIMNLKGGVGKTVTAINLADVLAAAGKRTLLVDCDGQMSLTRFYLPDLDPDNTPTLEGVLTGSCEPCWDDNIQEISDKVWLLPGSSGLYRMDVAAVRGGSAGWQKAMRDYRDAVAEDGEVDYLVFDCPPGFTCASIAALMAADDVVIPMLVDGFSFTKGCPVLKVPGTGTGSKPKNRETLLFDLQDDPEELRPIRDEAIEKRMTSLMVDLMKANDAPEEQYDRLGLR